MKQVKNFSIASVFALALLVSPGIVNAEGTVTNNTPEIVLLEDGCTSSTSLTLSNGDKVNLKGSCGSVRRQIKKYQKAGLL